MIVFGAAIAWIGVVVISTRHQLRHGGIVSPPLFASTLLFALGMVIGLVLAASPLHLLWWFPLSAVLGIVLMIFPSWVNLLMACLGLLAGLKPRPDDAKKC